MQILDGTIWENSNIGSWDNTIITMKGVLIHLHTSCSERIDMFKCTRAIKTKETDIDKKRDTGIITTACLSTGDINCHTL